MHLNKYLICNIIALDQKHTACISFHPSVWPCIIHPIAIWHQKITQNSYLVN